MLDGVQKARRAEAAIGPDEDASMREASLELANKPSHQRRRVAAVAGVAGAQAHARKPTLAVEHQQREVDVAVVVRVEEAQGLLPVRRVVGRVEVEDDLGRAHRQGGDVLVLK